MELKLCAGLAMISNCILLNVNQMKMKREEHFLSLNFCAIKETHFSVLLQWVTCDVAEMMCSTQLSCTCFIIPSPHGGTSAVYVQVTYINRHRPFVYKLTKGQTSSARKYIEMPSMLSAGQKSFESIRCQAKHLQKNKDFQHRFTTLFRAGWKGSLESWWRWWIFTKELWSCSDASIVPTPITVRRLPCQSCLKSECWSDEHVSVNPDQTHTRQEAR